LLAAYDKLFAEENNGNTASTCEVLYDLMVQHFIFDILGYVFKKTHYRCAAKHNF
jgi:hypothetical protein